MGEARQHASLAEVTGDWAAWAGTQLAEAQASGATIIALDATGCPRLSWDGLTALVELAQGIAHTDITIEMTGAEDSLAVLFELTGVMPQRMTAGWPLRVHRDADETIRLVLSSGASDIDLLASERYSDWLGRIEVKAVAVDIDVIEQVNSMLINWLLHVKQQAGVNEVILLNVRNRVATLLKQMRLDHLLVIVGGVRN